MNDPRACRRFHSEVSSALLLSVPSDTDTMASRHRSIRRIKSSISLDSSLLFQTEPSRWLKMEELTPRPPDQCTVCQALLLSLSQQFFSYMLHCFVVFYWLHNPDL